jgi:hypothetical protein
MAFSYVVWHFPIRFVQQNVASVADKSQTTLLRVLALTGYWLFAFYGPDRTSGEYGIVSQILSTTFKYFLFLLAIVVLTSKYAFVDHACASAGAA